jgi:hypothetical protein
LTSCTVVLSLTSIVDGNFLIGFFAANATVRLLS